MGSSLKPAKGTAPGRAESDAGAGNEGAAQGAAVVRRWPYWMPEVASLSVYVGPTAVESARLAPARALVIRILRARHLRFTGPVDAALALVAMGVPLACHAAAQRIANRRPPAALLVARAEDQGRGGSARPIGSLRRTRDDGGEEDETTSGQMAKDGGHVAREAASPLRGRR